MSFLYLYACLLEDFVVALWAGGHSRVNNDIGPDFTYLIAFAYQP